MSTPAIIPLRQGVVVQLHPLPPASSLLVTGAKRSTAQEATIVRVGDEVTDLAIGQRVLVSKLAGVAVGPDELVLLPASAILCTVSEP